MVYEHPAISQGLWIPARGAHVPDAPAWPASPGPWCARTWHPRTHPAISQGLRILARRARAPGALTRCSRTVSISRPGVCTHPVLSYRSQPAACAQPRSRRTISRPVVRAHIAPSHAPGDLAGPEYSACRVHTPSTLHGTLSGAVSPGLWDMHSQHPHTARTCRLGTERLLWRGIPGTHLG